MLRKQFSWEIGPKAAHGEGIGKDWLVSRFLFL